MADKFTLADLMEEQRTLGGPPALPNVMPREMRQPVLGQSNLIDTALSSFGRPSLEALRMGYEGKATPQEIARTFLETGPMGPLGAVRNPVPNPIRAYHGSPHDFDEFRLDRIGSGEGAQAYGNGLYFAEAEPVARQYRDALSRPNSGWSSRPEPDGPNRGLYRGTAFYPGNDLRIREQRFFPTPEEARAWSVAEADKAAPGRMYEVNLHARPEQFLDWDAPIGRQPPEVAGRLRPFVDEAHRSFEDIGLPRAPDAMSVREFLDTHRNNVAGRFEDAGGSLPNFMAEHGLATDSLREAGIPGIRYLDQGSRTAGQGTSNYVVFSPEIIEILRKYGIIAPPVGIGAAAAMSGDAQQ